MSEATIPMTQYTEKFRLEAVRLADSVGGHEAARRRGIPIATLSNWSRHRRKAPSADTTEPASGRLAR
jgi:transposase